MKICLVSNEILGATANGGIGTATSHLGLLLSQHGHRVSLLYTGLPPIQARSPWKALYETHGLEVVHLLTDEVPVSPSVMRPASAIYEYLKGTDFDVIVFQDFLALGQACTVAKTCGLAFSRTVLATIAHGSTPWVLEANQRFPDTTNHLTMAHMEQQAMEHSDALVSPSEYLLNWMRRAGWKLPRHSSVIPYHLSAVESLPTNLPKVSEGDVRNPSHLVFFGRLEGRKGIDIFLKALASERLRQYEFRLTFLGRPASLSASEIEETIAQSRPDLLPGLRIQTDLTSDEAQLFLTQNDCVVVIPSLLDNSPCVVYESIRLKLPLIASASGGIGELIHQDDHARCLFPPTADHLARKIEEVLSAEIWEPARPSYEMSQVADAWLSWFSQLASQGEVLVSDRVDAAPKPDVSVVLVHYERPKLLQQCLQALASQTDSDFDLIVVDDGSRSEEARAALRRIEGGFPGLRLKLVRQENKHAGAARNAGLRHVTTACVIFQDDDNVPFPNMVEVFRNAIHASNADVVSCQMRMFRDSSKEPNARLHGEERYAFPGGPVALGFLDNVFGDATSIFRRKVFDDTGSFTEERQLAYEDWHMYLRAVLCGCRLLSIPEPLYWYRVSPDSIQRTAASYESMRIIASVVQSQSFPALAPLVDLAIGRLRPLMLDEYGQKPQGPTVARYGADRESVLDDRIDNLKRQVDAIYGSRIWKGLTWLGGVIQKVTPGSHPRKKGL